MKITEIATLFSGGKFDEAADYVSDNIEWNIYEEKMVIQGKDSVLKFCASVAEYFKSLTTKFELFGMVLMTRKLRSMAKPNLSAKGKPSTLFIPVMFMNLTKKGRSLKFILIVIPL